MNVILLVVVAAVLATVVNGGFAFAPCLQHRQRRLPRCTGTASLCPRVPDDEHDRQEDELSSSSVCSCDCACHESKVAPQSTLRRDTRMLPPTILPRRDFFTWTASTAACLLGSDPTAAAAATTTSSTLATTNNASWDPTISFSSTRKYKSIILPNNGLRVLLVQDAKAPYQQAAAALSIGGAGQWADYDDLPGVAHLCEHMVLSSTARRRRFRSLASQQAPYSAAQDFEEWLADHDGSSNGFTAYDNVCFHFTCPDASLEEGLERFACLFEQNVFERVCRNPDTLKREIQRVDSELDYNNLSVQTMSLAKAFVTFGHPYGRFSAGNAETLEQVPKVANIDVAERLVQFFRTKYQPNQAILVVTAPQDFVTLQKWVAPFATTLSRESVRTAATLEQPIARRFYPGGFLQGSRSKQMVILHRSNEGGGSISNPRREMTEPLQMEWILNLDYTEAMQNGKAVVTGTQIAFCLAQILGRRGPGSLYAFLLRRGWVSSGNSGVPRVALPVDVSGFQIVRLEIQLTVDGFLERSAVVAAVYDSIEALRRGTGFVVVRELVTQWASVAKLHGYLLTPRPPDAIELAQDVHTYGLDGPNGVGSGWYRFPEPDDRAGIRTLQKSLASTLLFMSDPGNALVIAAANSKTVELAKLPPLETSRRWRTEPLTGGRFLYDDMLGLTSRIEELVLMRLIDREELLRPVINPLVPIILKTPRPLSPSGVSDPRSTNDILPLIARDSAEPSREYSVLSSSSSFAKAKRDDRDRWVLLEPAQGGQDGLPLPRHPVEPNYRSVFVVNLLSSRPARASLREGARGELFKLSFEYAVSDLAELGAPGGLAYDVSFNRYGMRLAFMGVNQNLPSYVRRFCRRLVEHPGLLLQGPEFFPPKITSAAVTEARLARGFSQQRRNTLISCVRGSTAYEAAAEGNAFLRSCSGAVCFAEGDWSTTREVLNLQKNLEEIFAPFLSSSGGNTKLPAMPSLDDLIYKPVWKPRFGSPCTLAGVMLISDACGRVPR